MRIKAGKYTLALTMILCGILMLISTVYGHGIFSSLWQYSPLVLIVFGLEIIVLNLIFGAKENYKVEVSVGCIILIIFLIAMFMVWTNRAQLNEHFINGFFEI